MSNELVPVVAYDGPLANLLDSGRFEQLQRVAKIMANQSFTPKHLVGANNDQTVANCFRVVNQAIRWGFDPYAVADDTYVVHGRIAFQGKLVAAVINARAGLPGKLRPLYNAKQGLEFAVVVYSGAEPISEEGKKALWEYAENEDRKALAKLTGLSILAVRLSVGQGKTDNQMWLKDPEQKLWYSGAVKFARRHCPEVILGVLTDDDAERIPEVAETSNPPVGRFDLRGGTNGNGTTPKVIESAPAVEPGLAGTGKTEPENNQTFSESDAAEPEKVEMISPPTIKRIRDLAAKKNLGLNDFPKLIYEKTGRRQLEDSSQANGMKLVEHLESLPDPVKETAGAGKKKEDF